MFSSPKLGLSLLLAFVFCCQLSAQVFKIDGGTSTLFNADGGTITIKAPNYDSSFGAGMFDGHFEMGAVARTKAFGYTVTAGDDSIRFDLPTDIFGNTDYYYARGVGISRKYEEGGVYVLGGLTSQWEGSSFFQAAKSQDPVGIIFFDRHITDQLHLYSRNIISVKSSALQALEWKPEKWVTSSITAGMGSGKPYLATAIDTELRKLTLKASYAYVNPDFRRITVPEIFNSEPERENIEATYHFDRDTSITAAHRNLMQPLALNSPFVRASMDEITGNFRVGSNFFGAGLFTSRFSGRDSWGSNFYAGHHFYRLFDVTGSYFVSKSTGETLQSMITGTFREIISPRFNLLQVLTYNNGQTSLAYGGEFITNRFNVNVDYQTQYLAFRTNNPFQQTLSFNASVRVFGPLSLNATSSVAPDGHVRYSFGGTTYLYRAGGLFPSLGQSNDSYRFPKYMVQGIVKDQEGKPISGAAVQLDNDVIFTDGDGRFIYRTKKHHEMKLAIVPSQFLVTGFFELVQAPQTIHTEKEDQAQEVIIIVRRLTPQEAKLGPLAKADYQKYEPKLPGRE